MEITREELLEFLTSDDELKTYKSTNSGAGYEIATNENGERIKNYKWQPVHQFDSTHGMKPEIYMDLEKASKAFDKIYLLHSWNDFKDIPNIEYYS